MGVCLLAGVMHRLSMISTLMKSKTYFLAGWLVSDVLEPTLQYSDWLRFIPESPAKALNSSVGDPASSSRSVTWNASVLFVYGRKAHSTLQNKKILHSIFKETNLALFFQF